MSDTYQAIYDAVRSKLSNGDIGDAVSNAVKSIGISDYVWRIANQFEQTAQEMRAPSVMYHPKLYKDGDKWCALYGDNIQEGVCGFGDTPSLAMNDFDRNFLHEAAKNAC